MGIEIVGVLIYPVVLICVPAAFLFWLAAIKAEYSTAIGYVSGYLPLLVGFAVSMAGLTLLSYIEADAYFTWLVERGFQTESQRSEYQSEYLPGKVVEQAIIYLMLVLPAICFVVIPCTVRLIRTRRLTLGAIGLRAAIAWVALSLIGWLLSLGIHQPHALSGVLKSTVAPVLIYGLPIPLAALLFFRRRWRPVAEGQRG